MFKPTRSPVSYLLLILGVGLAGFMLLILGALTALAPDLVVRLMPVILVGVVMLSAGFVRTGTVNRRFVGFWLVAIIVTATLWPSYVSVRLGGLPSIDLRKVVFGLSVLVLLYLAVAQPLISSAWRELTPGAKWLAWCVLIYGLLRMVSALGSPVPIAAFLAVTWEWVYYYVPFFIALLLMRDAQSRHIFVRSIYLLILVVVAFAIYERFVGANPLVRWASVSGGAQELVAALNLSRVRDGVFRAQATFEHPLLLAEFAAVAAAFTFGQFLNGAASSARVLGLAGFLVAVVAAVLSGSRIALVSLVIVVVTVLLSTGVRARGARKVSAAIATRLFVLLSILVIAAASLPLLQGLFEGRTTTEASSSSARLQMLKSGIPAMLEEPFFGKGYGEAVFEAGVQGTGGLLTLDNYLLTVGIDSGVPALLIFVAIFIVPAWMAFKRVTDAAGEEQGFLISALAALVGLLAVRLILSIPYNLVFAFVIAALVAGAIPKKQVLNGKSSEQ